jgi:glycosyltransferase involved in cell wall biosynthesis
MSSAGAAVSVACNGAPLVSGGPGPSFVAAGNPSRRIAYPRGLRPYVAESDVFFLHSGWTPYNVWAARIARGANVPYVITPHGSYNPHIVRQKQARRLVWWHLAEARFLKQAAAVHLFFEEEKEHLRALGYSGPCLVAGNGVERPPLSWDGGSGGYVLWMGRYEMHWKGIDVLLRSLLEFDPSDRPRLRLHGPDSPGRAEVQSLVGELGLERWVEARAAVGGHEKWTVLKAARAFAFPSRWDSHSIAVMEAAAVGLPIVASSTTAVGRRLAAEGAAVAAEPNASALAAAMSSALSDAGRDFARRAAELTATEYTWERSGRLLVDQLEAVV